LPNSLNAAFELRVPPWRVLYNVDEVQGNVYVKAVGYKPRERLMIEGQEVEL
jgi:hypothetical protein